MTYNPKQKLQYIIDSSCYLIYIIMVLYITLFNRETLFEAQYNFEFLWSFKKAYYGDIEVFKEIVLNAILFVPWGWFVARAKKNRILLFCIGVSFSIGIEYTQYIKQIGLAEIDDVFTNVSGIVIGIILYCVYKYFYFDKNRCSIKSSLLKAVCFCILCVSAIVYSNSTHNSIVLENEFAFQAESIQYDYNCLTISGYCFRYDVPVHESDYEIALKGKSGIYRMNTTSNTERPDVNKYFNCEVDYTFSGFVASISQESISATEEYEIMVDWKNAGLKSAGVYIKNNRLYYCNDVSSVNVELLKNDSLVNVVNHGILVADNLKYSCSIYQYDGYLYWFAGDKFIFEDNEKTYIQYQLWTTQIDNLPYDRIVKESYWDNIGFIFEEAELLNASDYYRVAVRKIPDNYSIKAIVTGYYKNNKWIWQEYFRPFIVFEN